MPGAMLDEGRETRDEGRETRDEGRETRDELRPSSVVPRPSSIEPITIADMRKRIVVPGKDFDAWIQKHDWTYHQLARNEFPWPFENIDQFQMACICSDPYLWCSAFLREPEDPNHKDPYNFFDYQVESLRYRGNTIHKCGAEVGKTREIVAITLYLAFTTPNGSGLIGAPQQTHLDEIIEALDDQLRWNADLGSKRQHHRIKEGWKKHPHHAFYFQIGRNTFKIDFRPSGHDGEAYRGIHARTFAIKDEAAKDKNKKQWSEFWRAMKPGCVAKIYSVPDGDRSCEFYKLGERAKRGTEPNPTCPELPQLVVPGDDEHAQPVPLRRGIKGEEINKQEAKNEQLSDVPPSFKNLTFRLFQWAKTVMPNPYWNDKRRAFYREQYGGEDSPEYKHNVLGEDGDPEYTVFPWHQFGHCIKDIPEYRGLKIFVDSHNNEVCVQGYKCEFAMGNNGPQPRQTYLMDDYFPKTSFFELDETGESEFRRLIKSFFVTVTGHKRGGADFGYSGDPTEILIKTIIGKKERVVARLSMKHVTYDQQCQALDAMDDVYGPPETITWGTDFGNAGSAVAHDLQGLSQFAHKHYDERLKGFQFESTSDNVDDEGEPVIDAKTDKPLRITLKELSTDHLTKKMQRLELEYPPDPDFILYYPNHTVRNGGKHRIYKKQDDHVIDADRAQKLAHIFTIISEDYFD